MEIKTVWSVYFSATGTTEKVVTTLAKTVAQELGAQYQAFSFNLPKSREDELTFGPDDLVVMGVPVYAGRVPNLLLPYVRDKVKAQGALAIPVVLYGNRNFDDGLMELKNVMGDNGFMPVAAGAFVGEHSFSTILGAGRPDADDMALVDELAQYADAFEHIAVGAPLLTSDGDFQAVADAITQATAQYDDGDTAICFMGHGTEAESNRVYGELQQVLNTAGHDHYYVGTVEAEPTLEDVLAGVKDSGAHKVVLQPLMIVAGDHANNDMAGDEEGSWKRAFQDAGYEVECVLKGLGELEAIQQLFAAHAQAAMDTLES